MFDAFKMFELYLRGEFKDTPGQKMGMSLLVLQLASIAFTLFMVWISMPSYIAMMSSFIKGEIIGMAASFLIGLSAATGLTYLAGYFAEQIETRGSKNYVKSIAVAWALYSIIMIGIDMRMNLAGAEYKAEQIAPVQTTICEVPENMKAHSERLNDELDRLKEDLEEYKAKPDKPRIRQRIDETEEAIARQDEKILSHNRNIASYLQSCMDTQKITTGTTLKTQERIRGTLDLLVYLGYVAIFFISLITALQTEKMQAIINEQKFTTSIPNP